MNKRTDLELLNILVEQSEKFCLVHTALIDLIAQIDEMRALQGASVGLGIHALDTTRSRDAINLKG